MKLQAYNLQLCENSGSGRRVRYKVFCCEICEISQNNFMEHNFEQLPVDDKRCCGKYD